VKFFVVSTIGWFSAEKSMSAKKDYRILRSSSTAGIKATDAIRKSKDQASNNSDVCNES
jgi:hypothetical protein